MLRWDYDAWFRPPDISLDSQEVLAAIELVDECGIDSHPFFDLAARSRSVLKLWVSQELVVTGPFSQLLHGLAARIDNVHTRAMVSAVAAAEHGAIRGNTAPFAHPWLLYSLGRSVRLTDDEMVILPETAQFLEMISKDCERSPQAAAGVLGMGSERLLVPEYTAARNAFEKCWPECDFRRFLNANIEEDVRHAELMENVGRALLSLGHRDGDFLSGAQVGIEARIVYYDALVERVGTGRICE